MEYDAKEFETYLRLKLSLSDRSIELVERLVAGCFRRFPDEAMPFDMCVADMYDRDLSKSHIRNSVASFEKYGDFIHADLKFGRPTKQKYLIEPTLSEAESVILVYKAGKPRDKVIITTFSYSGIRVSELTDLKIEDVVIGRNILRIRSGKGGKGREVFIPGELAAMLSRFIYDQNRRPGDWLFVNQRNGQKLSTYAVRKLVRKVAKEAGFKRRVHPHLFRHSLATQMINRGASIFAVQRQLGHSDIMTTMRYIQASEVRAKSEYQLYAPRLLGD